MYLKVLILFRYLILNVLTCFISEINNKIVKKIAFLNKYLLFFIIFI